MKRTINLLVKNKVRIIALCLMVALTSGLSAQKRGDYDLVKDTIFHKSGLTYYGKIVLHERDGVTRMKGAKGWSIQFESENIDRIAWSEESKIRFMAEIISLDSIPLIDAVHLQDGSILKGEILEYQRGDFLVIKIQSGELRINESDIEKIVQEPKDPLVALSLERQKKVKPYAFRERGFYGTTVFGLLPGGGAYRDQLGLSLQASFGYQFKRQLGAGIGLSLDGYANADGGDTFIPVFAEARGYLWKRKSTPYWTAAAGYGFPLRTEIVNQEVRRFEGGMMFHPAIGYRLGGDKTINLTVDVGYKFQRAITEREFFFSGEIVTREVLYRRLSLRMSVIF